MISIKMIGVNQYRKDFIGFSNRLPILTKRASKEIITKIHEQAMENLNENIRWGHSVMGDGIEQSMQMIDSGRDSIELVYTSPHAFIVEYGGIGEVIREQGVFPIGASQGNVMGFSPRFKLQQGKHYLERAVNTIMNSDDAEKIVTKYISSELGKF